jgi:hypothetical protein
MDDAEMEWLQSKDAASCAVWEWYKCDSQKRGDGSIRDLSEQEIDTVSRRLGIDSPRFSQISQNLQALKWISQNAIRGWQKWQGARTPEEDAARKQAEYWKSKALEKNTLENPSESLPVSPKTSHSLPKPPLEENRGEQSINPPIAPHAQKSKAAKGPIQLRACSIFHRRPETPLTQAEHRAFSKSKAAMLATSEEDWQLMERFYAAPQPETYARKDLATLVNNWNGELDRARAWSANGKPKTLKSTPLPPLRGTATDEATLKNMAAQLEQHRRTL